jgi:hypothetical protein
MTEPHCAPVRRSPVKSPEALTSHRWPGSCTVTGGEEWTGLISELEAGFERLTV